MTKLLSVVVRLSETWIVYFALPFIQGKLNANSNQNSLLKVNDLPILHRLLARWFSSP